MLVFNSHLDISSWPRSNSWPLLRRRAAAICRVVQHRTSLHQTLQNGENQFHNLPYDYIQSSRNAFQPVGITSPIVDWNSYQRTNRGCANPTLDSSSSLHVADFNQFMFNAIPSHDSIYVCTHQVAAPKIIPYTSPITCDFHKNWKLVNSEIVQCGCRMLYDNTTGLPIGLLICNEHEGQWSDCTFIVIRIRAICLTIGLTGRKQRS